MHLFNLNMSNIKSEALFQECSKREIFLKILQNSFENNCAGVSLIIKVLAEGIKTKFYVHIIWHGYFSVKFAKFFRATLKTPTIL